MPWLQQLNIHLCETPYTVLACSVLKQSYRHLLMKELAPIVIWLDVKREEVKRRIKRRSDHFMPSVLIDSQYEIVELTEDMTVVDGCRPLKTIVSDCLGKIPISAPR